MLAVDRVIAFAAVENVVAEPTENDIVAIVAFQDVIAFPTIEEVIAALAKHLVITQAAEKVVSLASTWIVSAVIISVIGVGIATWSGVTKDNIIAIACVDEISSDSVGSSIDIVIAGSTINDVCVGAAEQIVIA